MTATIKVRTVSTKDVSFDVRVVGTDAVVLANGVPVIKFTKAGYLSRLRGVARDSGLRTLTRDGSHRVAIKKRSTARR